MWVESGGDCFDSTLLKAEDDGFSQNPSFSIEEDEDDEEEEAQPYYHQNSPEHAAMDMELIQQQLNLEQCYNTHNDGNNGRFIQELGDWGFSQYHQLDLHTSLPPTTDLLGMFSLLPSSSLLPNPSISFSNNTYPEFSSFLSSSLGLSGDLPTGDDTLSPPASSNLVCDPSMFPLSSLPGPQPSLLFHSLAHGFGGSSSGSLFDEGDQEVLKNSVAFYQEDVNGGRAFGNGVFEFTADINGLAKNRDGKDPKHFATEKQRRVHFNDKFQALRKLIPNPSKNDRASILGDAIEYINELKSTATKLKVLVEKKRSCSRERNKGQKTATDGVVKSEEDHMLQSYNGVSSTRSRSSSWHRRKSKNNTEVDVRIVDDEVTVKLVQQRHKGTNNCLLLVSKVLDALHLHLYHVAGGLIGDYYCFLFNSKIFQGTTVYASAIANMLVEAAEEHYTTGTT